MGHRILYIPKPVSGIFYPAYGLLYNGYAFGHASYIANTGWKIPTSTDWDKLISNVGTNPGYKVKEADSNYWTSITNVTNSSKFNARGAGYRVHDTGVSQSINVYVTYLSNTITLAGYYNSYRLFTSLGNESKFEKYQYEFIKGGCSVRLIKESTSLSAGEESTYTGNDGRIYRTIAIGDSGGNNVQEWLADNLVETRFRNGDIIPWYGANPANYFTNAEWAALTTAGCAAYANTLSNVGPSFTFPT